MPMQIQNINTVQPTLSVPQAQEGGLSLYQPGDTLTAVVTGANGDTATLLLPDGSEVEAAVQSGQQLEAQDTLTLQMSQLSGRAASLRLVAVNGQPVTAEVPLLDFKLMQMNIAPTRANVTAAGLLTNMELPVTPQALARFANITRGYPLLPMENAALLAASDIPVTPKSVSAFTQFLQSPVQAEEFAAALRAFSQGAQGEAPAAAQNGAGLTNLLSTLSPKLAALFSPQTEHAAQAQAAQQPQTAAGATQDASAAQTAQTTQAPITAQTTQQAPAQAATQSAQAPPLALSDTQAVQTALQAVFPKLQPAQSEELGKALQRAVPKLPQSVAALADAAAKSANPAARELNALGTQLTQQFQFGNELGTLYYTQIPFSRDDRQQNAELYVLKRKGSAEIDQDNVTVALCLQTRNIGRVETLLQVKDRVMSFQFRVESEAAQTLLRDNLETLRARPFPAQYKLKDMSVGLLETPITPVNATKAMLGSFGQLGSSAGVDISL